MALSAEAAQAAQQTDMNTNRWSAYMVQLYNTRIPPSIKSFDFSRLEAEAREKTKEYHGRTDALPVPPPVGVHTLL
ncbi:hypothetical protein EWM64_g9117 [Hericium alpestre]|uniref:Uncharacterized protein n=1 Tax=Hericium alpestre TaxID=135208 RepID=A0A4Y9ZJY0_9AGAM|nr:hypothetical protein EWM64_g9117 [Hericium alpestre]